MTAVIGREISIKGFDVAINNADDLKKAIKDLNGVLSKTPESAKGYKELNTTLATLKANQQENRKEARLLSTAQTAAGKTGAGAYRKISAQLIVSRTKLKDYLALQAQGIRLSKSQEKEFKDLTLQVGKYDRALKKIDKAAGQSQRNVGNYSGDLAGFGTRILGAFGIVGGVSLIGDVMRDFISDAKQLSLEAKSVDFAFERIRGSREALDSARSSTRGLLADIDIKKTINEFDQFGLSIDKVDTLLEFVAVASSQTGKSFEQLQNSLVEGLSKESTLRIDNLGISVVDLNKELEKTPVFIDAVANIAERRIANAGSILDDAANAQQRWNVRIENTKLALGEALAENGVVSEFYDSIGDIVTQITQRLQGGVDSTDAFLLLFGDNETQDRTISRLEKARDLQKEIDEGRLNDDGTKKAQRGGGLSGLGEVAKKALAQLENASKNLDKEINKIVDPEKGSISNLKKIIADINKDINNSNLTNSELSKELTNLASKEAELKKLEDRLDRLKGEDLQQIADSIFGGNFDDEITGGNGSAQLIDPNDLGNNTIDTEITSIIEDNQPEAVVPEYIQVAIDAENKKKDDLKESLKEQAQAYVEHAEEVGEIVGRMIGDANFSAEQGLKAIGGLLLDNVEKHLLAAITTIKVDSIAQTFLNPAAFLKGLAQVAAVKGIVAGIRGSLLAEQGVGLDPKGNVLGKRHSRGGENYVINGRNVNVEQGEKIVRDDSGSAFVINRTANAAHGNALDMIQRSSHPNKAALYSAINQSKGNGIAFAEKGAAIIATARQPSTIDVINQSLNNSANIETAVARGSEIGSQRGTNKGITKASETSRKLSDLNYESKF